MTSAQVWEGRNGWTLICVSEQVHGCCDLPHAAPIDLCRAQRVAHLAWTILVLQTSVVSNSLLCVVWLLWVCSLSGGLVLE